MESKLHAAQAIDAALDIIINGIERGNQMTNNCEFQIRCIGLENNNIFPLENTGRRQDFS